MTQQLRLYYGRLSTFLSLLQSPLLLVMRLYWGWHFFMAGKGKLIKIDHVVDYFQSLNIPFPKINAVMAGSTECFGGLLLLLGLFSRIITIPLSFVMLIAYFTAERTALLNIFSDPDTFLSAAPFLFLLTTVFVMAFGPGVFSLDHLLGLNSKTDKCS
ncbi:MAG: DoxX family protein [Deltaproteobacteria bacterium]|nr:DoxX family protein [Deltaproteobacteria bacterium]